jgi:hypothetical protein
MSLPANWKDCYFILYKRNEDGTVDSTYAKPIMQAQRKTGELLDFYGVRASKYGIKVPPTSVGWAIIHTVDGSPKTIISGDLIEPKSKRIWELSDGRVFYMRRGNTNISINISMYPKAFKSLSV